jgi:hypothetical protein
MSQMKANLTKGLAEYKIEPMLSPYLMVVLVGIRNVCTILSSIHCLSIGDIERKREIDI